MQREDSDITTLRFDKQALESQLKKSASHCQTLDEEKARCLKVLRANKRSGTDDVDIVKAIVGLCDHVASLEKERALLTQAANPSRSNKEMEGLTEQISLLRSQLTETKKMLEWSRQTESENQHRIAKLEQDALHTQEALAKSGRKIQNLEQENLQCLHDNKELRRKYQAVKSELNVLRLKGNTDDTTFELAKLKSKYSSTDTGASGPSTSRARRARETDAATDTRKTPGRKPKFAAGTPAADKNEENGGTNQAAIGSSRKKDASSASKWDKLSSLQKRSGQQHRTTPGLGEAGAPVEDGHTQECTQS